MAIITSVLAEAVRQVDGRYSVLELHTDQVGVVYQHTYLAPANADLNVNMAAYATALWDRIQQTEINNDLFQIEALGSLAVVTTVYVTLSQVIVAARAAYATATQLQAINLGDWFASLTFVQLQSAFGFANVSAYNNFKATFFTPQATTASTVRASAGA